MADLLNRANVNTAINTLLDDAQPNEAIQPSDHNGLLKDILDTLANGLSTSLRTNPETGGQDIEITSGDKLKYKSSTFFNSLVSETLTADRTLTLPNKTGTIAILSDIQNLFTDDLTLGANRSHNAVEYDWKITHNATDGSINTVGIDTGKILHSGSRTATNSSYLTNWFWGQFTSIFTNTSTSANTTISQTNSFVGLSNTDAVNDTSQIDFTTTSVNARHTGSTTQSDLILDTSRAQLVNQSGSGSKASVLALQNTLGMLYFSEGSINSQVEVNNTYTLIKFLETGANAGGGQLQISRSLGHLFVDNNTTPSGIKYFADYSANFTARSLVDKGYVDANAGGDSIYTADGTLSGARILTLDGNDLSFEGNAGINATNTTAINPTKALLSLKKSVANSEDRSTYIEGFADRSGSTLFNYWKIFLKGTSNYNNNNGIGFYFRSTQPKGTEYGMNGIDAVDSALMIQNYSDSTPRFQLYGGTDNTTGNGYLKFWSSNALSQRIQIARSGKNFINPNTDGGFSDAGLIVMGDTYVGNESISLQGHTLIKGADTLSTSSALQIYDGDSTPNLLWDFRNNGDIHLGSASVINIGSNNLDINGSALFSVSNGAKSISTSWNTHTIFNLNNGNGTTYSLYSGNASSTFNAGEFGIGVGSNIPIKIFNGSSVALGNVTRVNLDTNYNVQTNGNALIGGTLDTKSGVNEISLDHNNYPKLKISNGTQEYWLIEGDGTGATFNSGDLYLYDNTNSRKLLQFKANGTINMPNLPTSSTGLSAGDIYNDGGTLKIV